MPDQALAGRYASALFAAAVKREVLDAVEADLGAVVDLLHREPGLRTFLHSPQVLTEHKVEMLHKVVGARVERLLYNFLLLLIDKKRFDHLDEIAEALVALADEHRGLVKAQVTTAFELDDELRDRLQARLAAVTGKKITLECRTDPSLIGGISVVMGDKLLDGSVRGALARLREDLGVVSVL